VFLVMLIVVAVVAAGALLCMGRPCTLLGTVKTAWIVQTPMRCEVDSRIDLVSLRMRPIALSGRPV